MLVLRNISKSFVKECVHNPDKITQGRDEKYIYILKRYGQKIFKSCYFSRRRYAGNYYFALACKKEKFHIE